MFPHADRRRKEGEARRMKGEEGMEGHVAGSSGVMWRGGEGRGMHG